MCSNRLCPNPDQPHLRTCKPRRFLIEPPGTSCQSHSSIERRNLVHAGCGHAVGGTPSRSSSGKALPSSNQLAESLTRASSNSDMDNRLQVAGSQAPGSLCAAHSAEARRGGPLPGRKSALNKQSAVHSSKRVDELRRPAEHFIHGAEAAGVPMLRIDVTLRISAQWLPQSVMQYHRNTTSL